jgi:MSHA biogenesis protein MshG
MPQFNYSARDDRHALVTGMFEAASAGHVADWLMNSGMTPVVIEPAREVQDAREVLGRWFKRDRITPIELLMFTRQMVTLSRAGIPIMRALRGLESSATRPAVARLMRDLYGSLDTGLDLSQAMALRDDAFDAFYVSMVRVGEQTGRLEEIFLNLFHHLEFQKFMREQVKTALRYPSFVVMAMIAAVAVINIFVIPAFAKVFAGMKAELPLMTRILLGTSNFTVTWWPALLAAGGAAVFAARSFVATDRGRLWWDRSKLRLPIAGSLVRKGVLAQATRSLALIFKSGVPLVQGLSLTAAVVENAHVSQALLGMRSTVERGDSMLSASSKAGVFTPVVLQMIMVGEESGSLGEMLDEIGTMYQQEVEYELKTLSSKIEPILIVMLGGMLLVLALGVFLPMWDMGSHAKQ